MQTLERVLFRFDAIRHQYIELLTGRSLPHVTGMLEAAGKIDTTWFTEESSERGTIVHRLTADYDLGAIEDPASVQSIHKAYFLGHVAAMKILRPEILAVEEPVVHPRYRYGTRPDRVVKVDQALAVLEIKAAQVQDSHQLQTALQAIALEHEYDLEAERWKRFALYLKPNGRARVLEHTDRSDFLEARRIIKKTCGGAR